MPLSRGPDDELIQEQSDDYFTRYLNGRQSQDDAQYEPELQDLLTKLYGRQQGEYFELKKDWDIGRQQAEDYRQTDIVELHFDDEQLAAEEKQEVKSLLDRFAEERERYISDHQRACEIRDQMEQDSRQETLEQDLDHKPKLTR